MALPQTEKDLRIKAVEKLLEDKGLDFAFVYFDEYNVMNGRYLTGYCLECSVAQASCLRASRFSQAGSRGHSQGVMAASAAANFTPKGDPRVTFCQEIVKNVTIR